MPTLLDKSHCHRLAFIGGWVLAILGVTASAISILNRPDSDKLADMQVYRGSVGLMLDGKSLYDFHALSNGDPFTYPPFAGIALGPLAFGPLRLWMIVWTIVTLAALAVCAYIAVLWYRRPAIDDVRPWVGLTMSAMLLSAPVSSNLRFGQVSVLLVFMVMADLYLLDKGSRWAGVMIGVAAAIKLTPLIFILHLLVIRRFKAAIVATTAFGLCTAAGLVLLPEDSKRFFLHELFQSQRIGDISSWSNQSMNGFLRRLPLNENSRSVILLLLIVVVLAGGLLVAARLYKAHLGLSAAVVTGATGVLVSPVSWTHHELWLVLAVALPIGSSVWRRTLWCAVVIAVMSAPILAKVPIAVLFGNMRMILAIGIIAAGFLLRPSATVTRGRETILEAS